MKSLKNYREIPIPVVENAATALDYHMIPIVLDSAENKEALLNLEISGLACSSYYARNDGLNAPYYKSFQSASSKLWLRKTVIAKLLEVNKNLAPYNIELLILDGYRPIKLQEELWAHFIQQAQSILENPSADDCIRFAGLYCSDPRNYKEDDYTSWPTHLTGAAIDLTLRCLQTKEPLYLGSIFDDASILSHTDYFEKDNELSSTLSHIEAKHNRRLLYWSMINAGFANFPYEWWHFDFGTQMWVMNSKKAELKAIYGRAEHPTQYE